MKKAVTFTALLAVLTGVGSINLMTAIPYIVIATVIVITVLVALDKVNERCYPVYIYSLALALLWQTSMLGSYIVGADIHGELFAANKAITGGWDLDWTYVNNTSLVLGGLTPLLAKLGISPIWQFKALYPSLFALVPVILYYAYRRMMNEKKAYFAALFFMIVPVFFVEIVGIVKSMVAEVFLALMILLMVSSLKDWQRALGIGVTAMLVVMCHYTVGILTIMYLIGGFVVLLVGKKWLKVRAMTLAYYSIAIIFILASGYLWFSTVGDSTMLRYVERIGRMEIAAVNYYLFTNTNTLDVDEAPGTSKSALPKSETPKSETSETSLPKSVTLKPETSEPSPPKSESYLHKQEPLIRAAIGLDFADVPIEGKVFRILQYLTQFLIVAGSVYLILRRRSYSFTPEFAACIVPSFGLLGMCLFFPGFSSLINATRYYQVCLFFLAPLLIVGAEQLVDSLRRLKKGETNHAHKIQNEGG